MYLGMQLEYNWNAIDLFTNVNSQIYGCFFPRDLVTSHIINLYRKGTSIRHLNSAISNF